MNRKNTQSITRFFMHLEEKKTSINLQRIYIIICLEINLKFLCFHLQKESVYVNLWFSTIATHLETDIYIQFKLTTNFFIFRIIGELIKEISIKSCVLIFYFWIIRNNEQFSFSKNSRVVMKNISAHTHTHTN